MLAVSSSRFPKFKEQDCPSVICYSIANTIYLPTSNQMTDSQTLYSAPRAGLYRWLPLSSWHHRAGFIAEWVTFKTSVEPIWAELSPVW